MSTNTISSKKISDINETHKLHSYTFTKSKTSTGSCWNYAWSSKHILYDMEDVMCHPCSDRNNMSTIGFPLANG